MIRVSYQATLPERRRHDITQDILDGAARAISDAFPSVPLYDEPVPQGLPLPALTVRACEPRQRLFRGQRYERWDTLEVTLFPPAENPKRFLADAFDRLFSALEIIEADGAPLRGSDMRAEDSDNGVGIFRVTYHYFCDRAGRAPLMDALTMRRGLDREAFLREGRLF